VFKVREEVVNVVVAGILQSYGLPNAALVSFDGVPDIYLILRGLRFILETKDQALENTLVPQIKDRVIKNLCELGVGLVYPTDVVADHLSMLTTKHVENRLLKSDLKVIAYGPHGLTARQIIPPTTIKIQQLPELLYRISESAMQDSEMTDAIEAVRKSVDSFSRNIASLGDARKISQQISEALEPK